MTTSNQLQNYDNNTAAESSAIIENRVLIVGAGPSGIATCKEFAESGFDPVLFEAGATLGGGFRDAYQNLELTSSTTMTAFSDYPPLEKIPTKWNAAQYLDYLRRYATDNKIFNKIQFNCRVVGVRRLRNDEKAPGNTATVWEITVHNTVSDKIYTVKGSKLVLSVGSNSSPNIPTFSGQSSFKGKVIHTCEVDGFEMFRGKRVLCLGLGESGSDVPYHIAKEPGTSVTIAARGAGWFVSRRRPLETGLPTDYSTSRMLWGIPRKIFNRPVSFAMAYLDSKDYNPPIIRKMANLNLEHPAGLFKTYGTKSIKFLAAVEEYGAKLKRSTIKSMGPNHRVQFVDGSEDEFDIVLLNTGYQRSAFEGFCFPKSDEEKHDQALHKVLSEASQPRNLFKRIVHPAMRDLFFIGFARPGFGSIPSISETQARLAVSFAAGRQDRLSENTMLSEIATDKARDEEQFDGPTLRVTDLVDYVPYINDVASLLGATPPYLKLLLTDPSLLFKMFAGPATVAQFRLRGPGAKPDVATTTIRGYPPIPKRRLTYIAAWMYAASLVVLLLSLIVPMTQATRKSMQHLGYPPVRSPLLKAGRYVLFWLHLFALSTLYSTITGVPELATGIMGAILILELRGSWQKITVEAALRKKLTTSAAVAKLDAGESLTEVHQTSYSSSKKIPSGLYLLGAVPLGVIGVVFTLAFPVSLLFLPSLQRSPSRNGKRPARRTSSQFERIYA